MNQLIADTGDEWYQLHASPRINVLDISRQGGGPFLPHGSHQNGLDVDIRYVRNDGQDGPLDLGTEYRFL